MALTLHYHPLASYCWKVLLALYEIGAPFTPSIVNLGDPQAVTAFKALWPTGQIPLLQDDDRVVPETSIIIEYLDHHYPGRLPLLPREPEAALATRLWDRLSDLQVMTPMQQIVAQQLRPAAERDPRATEAAHRQLAVAYAMLEAQLGTRRGWLVEDAFTMADCAAAPALFYAAIVHPIPADRPALAHYLERLVSRPTMRRVIAEARPFFPHFPFAAAIPPRFLQEDAGAG